MLTLSPLMCCTKDDQKEGEVLLESLLMGGNEFQGFSGGSNLLESIDFDDFLVRIEDGEWLPDLEMDSEMFSEFSMSGGSEEVEAQEKNIEVSKKEEEDKVSGTEIGCKREESVGVNSSRKAADKGRKSSGQSKSSHGKRKVKVDWTPELHKRLVQAVEQLGVDKAVPSKILEIMGIHCLTRHNIASHLQKYRSHRKHLLAREAGAASWSHRRQMYGDAGGGGTKINNVSPWLVPIIGFPQNPMTPLQHVRPLHVWGHPPADQTLMHMWPPTQPPPPAAVWASTLHPPPARPPPNHSFWHSHIKRVPIPLTQGSPYFQPPPTTPRFPAGAVVPGIPPPHAMYRAVDPERADPNFVPSRQPRPHPPFLDFHPSKDSIDSAIGDVLSKPWQPLPLGLKPPSLDSVMVELQRQGVSKIPPTCS